MTDRAQQFGGSHIALDLLRGLAALAVFLDHARGGAFVEFGALPAAQKTPAVASLFALSRLGLEAVLIFFVLSGLLVGGQIIARCRAADFHLSEYAVDRCCRILLPLIPACLFTEFVNVVAFRQGAEPLVLLGNVLGLNGVLVPTLAHNAPLWSLAYEIWFYVFGGVIGYLICCGGAKRASVVAVLALLACIVVFSILNARFLVYWAIAAFACLYLGIKHDSWLAIAGLAVAVVAIGCNQVAAGSKSVATVVVISPEAAQSLICAGVCLGLPLLCGERMNGWLVPLRRPAALLAALSYTLYLVHSPTLALLDLALPRAGAISALTIAYFLIRCGSCVAVATAFYFVFERNTVRLRRYLKARLLWPGASRPPAKAALSGL